MKLKKMRGVNFALTALMACGLILLSSAAGYAQEKTDAKLAKQAKISKEKARETAQAKEPNGKIEGEELEKEHGKLVYSFDIRNEKGTITEVQVDAKTGAVVSVEEEDAAAEAKEKAKDNSKHEKKDKHEKKNN